MVVSISSYKDISIVCVLRYTSATQLVWSERMRLKDKVAIISGGAKGMGAAEAKLFAREGARVVIADLLEDEGYRLEAEIVEEGGECVFKPLDVTSEVDWNDLVEFTFAKYGKLDILVNNAGVFFLGGIEDTSEEEWDRVNDVNSKGVFLGVKAAIPAMRVSGGGSIINISSSAALVGDPRMPAYSASKGAVRLLSKSVAIEYASEGIRCNSVHPGGTNTDMTYELFDNEQDLADNNALKVMRRRASPEEIANGVLFLASDESSYVTGSELVIDGGVTAR